MSVPLPTVQSTVPAVCRMLRTKNYFAAYDELDGVEPWEMGASTTAVYWCLNTMQTAGPDDNFAHPDICREGRSCFQCKD